MARCWTLEREAGFLSSETLRELFFSRRYPKENVPAGRLGVFGFKNRFSSFWGRHGSQKENIIKKRMRTGGFQLFESVSNLRCCGNRISPKSPSSTLLSITHSDHSAGHRDNTLMRRRWNVFPSKQNRLLFKRNSRSVSFKRRGSLIKKKERKKETLTLLFVFRKRSRGFCFLATDVS